jgi:hypothetical protein
MRSDVAVTAADDDAECRRRAARVRVDSSCELQQVARGFVDDLGRCRE